MKVFISWSGERSGAIAELIKEWIEGVIQATQPWMSKLDIEKGSSWNAKIRKALQESSIGIICLSKENKDKPWILFESGAIAKHLSDSLACTFLIDLKPEEVVGPLAQLNHTIPVREDMFTLVKTINNAMGEEALSEIKLEKAFDTYWPDFQERFHRILEEKPTDLNTQPSRTTDDILSELLNLTRSMAKRITLLEKQQNLSLNMAMDNPYITKRKMGLLSTGGLLGNLSEDDKEILDMFKDEKSAAAAAQRYGLGLFNLSDDEEQN